MTSLAQGTARRRPATTTAARRDERGKLGRSLLLLVLTLVVLVPIGVTLLLSVSPGVGSSGGPTIEHFVDVFTTTSTLTWLVNSLLVTVATVVVTVVVAAPAGYVLSRGRGRIVGGYSLLLFVVQSLPVITSVVPLFILFADFGLVDSLFGITIIYVGGSVAVATWMLAAYFDTIPASLEEAAWLDGASVLGGFVRIVLRNSLPGVLSTAIFTFLLAWNDYLVAIVFLRSDASFTLPLGVQSFFQQNLTDWGSVMAVAVVMLLPPVVVFAALNRYFSVGGISGALAGR